VVRVDPINTAKEHEAATARSKRSGIARSIKQQTIKHYRSWTDVKSYPTGIYSYGMQQKEKKKM